MFYGSCLASQSSCYTPSLVPANPTVKDLPAAPVVQSQITIHMQTHAEAGRDVNQEAVFVVLSLSPVSFSGSGCLSRSISLSLSLSESCSLSFSLSISLSLTHSLTHKSYSQSSILQHALSGLFRCPGAQYSGPCLGLGLSQEHPETLLGRGPEARQREYYQ